MEDLTKLITALQNRTAYVRAVEFWELVVEVGDPDSAYQLVVRLFHGDDGLPEDCDRAVELYDTSAASGSELGQDSAIGIQRFVHSL